MVIRRRKGEEELRQLMNQHPEQFQNVDPYFFVNTLDKMRSTIETQKALKKVRLEEQRKKPKNKEKEHLEKVATLLE